MATLRVPSRGIHVTYDEEVRQQLDEVGIRFERWRPSHPVAPDAAAAEILQAYDAEIQRLKQEGGYVTADVIDVKPETPNLDAMLAKFSKEHWHDEDEVRFIIEGHGIFHVHPRNGPTLAIEVGPGDLLRVPKGTWHWFDLCADRRIRAIRLFQDAAGWTPHYTDSGAEKQLQPVCLGPKQLTGLQ
jgi:1,2-dihydroxy-3-keto-5-methylthiopentene dioxygenase